MSTALQDLKLGLAEHQAANNRDKKRFSKRVVEMILWENRHEIVSALELVQRVSKPQP